MISRVIAAKEKLSMNLEKRYLKTFNVIAIVVLAAILLTVVGGILLQRQAVPAMGSGMRIGKGGNLMQPESAQSGPTGIMVLNTGIILLIIGFGVLLALLLVRRNLLHSNSS